MKKKAEDKHRIVFSDSQTRPLITWLETQTDENIEYEYKVNSLHITTDSDKADGLQVRVVITQYFTVKVDGKEVPMYVNGLNQVIVPVPPGKYKITIEYDDQNFKTGSKIAIVFLLFSIAGLCASKQAVPKT